MTKTLGHRAGDATRRLRSARVFSRGLEDDAGGVPIPDLLHLEPRFLFSRDAVDELLELAFLGREAARGLDRKLAGEDGPADGWDLELFARDLFVDELIRDLLTVSFDGVRYPVNQAYLRRVLAHPPVALAEVRFRQEILRELETDEGLRESARQLYRDLVVLLGMFKAPDHAAQLDVHAFRLDLLRLARGILDRMAEDFAGARSGLRRLAEAAGAIQESPRYRLLADLLDFESRQATLTVRLAVGGDGALKRLELEEIEENRENRFVRSPLGRWLQRLKLLVYGYNLDRKEILNHLLREVFLKISPWLTPLVQLVGQLELYLAGLSFRDRAHAAGLEVSLPTFDDRPLELERVWNPLLLRGAEPPVPASLELASEQGIVVVTGPNSGGKTRLLQTVGLTQLLGQSGLYTPAARANLPLLRGMFVSLVETETADQAEGRLARELLRIRGLFERVGSPAMVILDELCSGTNPAEGTEIFALVLQLLERLGATAVISTHFLDFARDLEARPPVGAIEFLRVETRDDLSSTYQFVPGVARTSLAAATAERLGVTFEELAELIDRRRTARA